MTIKDATGTFWHQIDTALTTPMVQHVCKLVGKIDLLFAAYAPQDFAFLGSQRGGYPMASLRERVARVREINPRLVVPASAGFRFADAFAWLNRFVFPVSRERFAAEIQASVAGVATAIANPGDVFDLIGGNVTHRPGTSRAVTMTLDDSDRIEFDPGTAVPPIIDANVERISDEVLRNTVEETFRGFSAFVQNEYATHPLIGQLRQRRTSYGIGVVFPTGEQWWLKIAFESTPIITRGQGTLRGALTVHRITASVLTTRRRWGKSYFYTLGLSRLSLVTAAHLIGDEVTLEPFEPHDLLLYFLGQTPAGTDPAWKRVLDHQLTPYMH